MVTKYVLLKIINNIEQFSKEEIDEFSTGSKKMLYQKVKSIIVELEYLTSYKFKLRVDNIQVYPEISLKASTSCATTCENYKKNATDYYLCLYTCDMINDNY